MKRNLNILYISLVAIVFAAIAIVFDTFPRSTFSVLEKRDLATCPAFTWAKLFDGTYTKEVSAWFSDSEPFRDQLMAMSMTIKEGEKVAIGGDDNVTFHASTDAPQADAEVEPEPEPDDRVV